MTAKNKTFCKICTSCWNESNYLPQAYLRGFEIDPTWTFMETIFKISLLEPQTDMASVFNK